MPMPSARGQVESYDRERKEVVLKNDSGLRSVHALHELNRGELMRLMAHLFPGSGRWASTSVEDMRRAAEENDASLRRVKEHEGKGKDQETANEPVTAAESATVTAPVVPAPAPPAPGSFDALLTSMMERVARDTVNEDTVRAMIDEAIALHMATMTHGSVTRIELPGREPIDLPGRQHVVFPDVLDLVDVREHVWLVGPAGTGKSTIGRHVAEALQLRCYAMSCNPQMPESRIFGFVDAQGVYRPSIVRRWWDEGGVLVLDEADNGHPGILTAFNLMLSSDEMTWPDGQVTKKHADAVVIACANTYGTGANAQYVGRNMIDGAFLDRFTMIHVGIDEALERDLVAAILTDESQCADWLQKVRAIRGNVDSHGLKMIVSPRASVTGAKLIKRGWKAAKVIDSRVLRGLSDDQRRKALTGVTL